MKETDRWKNIQLDEFTAPKTALRKSYVLHAPVNEITTGKPLKVEASVITTEIPESVSLHVNTPFGSKIILMENSNGYDYHAIIPAELLHLVI